MNRPQQKRFRKMRRLAQNEYDRRILSAARLRRDLEKITADIRYAEGQIEQIIHQLADGAVQIALWQSAQKSIERWQHQIQQLDTMRAPLQTELAQAMESVRQQKRKLDAWDKLIENAQRTQTTAELARDMQVADEQYLMGTFARSQQ